MSCLLLFAAAALAADSISPQVLDDRLQIQLVAESPDVRTPTGIAVDEQGRVLVIESHTHFPPPNYDGPKADRILLLDDFDPATGKSRKISTFFEGTTHTMNLAIYHDSSIYVATRMEIFRLRDTDDDGKADERTPICHLDTPGNYPHNGLSGLAFDFAGNIYFGFGENLGAEYKLIGSDGKELKGGGEGGNVYCCDPEGKNIRRVATGFWNPFGLGFDAFGRLFCVDNDPDSRPPCRLLHIVEGGDYGFRFRNGRKGVHPFTAWNGELPGTLPMVAGTGEAPCVVMAYESDNLPEEYRGDLLVTSWGDHRLERYKLRPRGASFSAEMEPVIRGGENFRPVGLALAPDGSLYMSDWVDKSYQLHGKGRVWRISAKQPAEPSRPDDPIAALASPHGPWREAAARKLTTADSLSIATTNANPRIRSIAARAVNADDAQFDPWLSALAVHAPDKLQHLAETLRRGEESGWDEEALNSIVQVLDDQRHAEFRSAAGESLPLPSSVNELDSNDPFILHAAVSGMIVTLTAKPALIGEFQRMVLAGDGNESVLVNRPWESKDGPTKLGWALILRRLKSKDFNDHVPQIMLNSRDPSIQLVGLEWIAELADDSHKGNVQSALAGAKSRQVFEAALVTLDILERGQSSDPKAESAGEAYIARIVVDENADTSARRLALRTLRPDHPAFTTQLLTQLLSDSSEFVRIEALRTIRLRFDAERWPQLRTIAQSLRLSIDERCEAILGLSPGNQDDRKLLFALTKDSQPEVADEALRALRGFDLTPEEKEQLTALAATLESPRKELVERVLARNPPKNLPKHEDVAAWLKLAEGEGDPDAGERIFYHLRVGGCFRCHEFEGRGYTVGPDLSTISRSMTRERLVQSLVDPSREIAPQFTNWSILKTDGEVLTGIHTGDEVDGKMRFADQNGRAFHVDPDEIDQRKPSSQSIMPAGLVDNLTAQELRDLIAFLLQSN